MPHFLKNILLNQAREIFGKERHAKISDYLIAKTFLQYKISGINLFKSSVYIALGILSAGFGLKGFLLPNGFIDGGVTGISLLSSHVSGISFSIFIVLINIPFIIMGYFQIGLSFAIKSILAIIGLAFAVHFVEYPIITDDLLLTSVFGGFFLGSGIGLAMRGGSVLDGTEVLAVYLTRKTGFTIGDLIFSFNLIIFSVAAYLLSIEVALYSVLTYLAASKTVDYVVEGVEEYIGVSIISSHYEEIQKMIYEKMGVGVTAYGGRRGGGKTTLNEMIKTEIIYTVITRLELAKLKNEIEKIDPNAFLVMTSVKDIKGGMIKRRPLH
ncbi:MAG: YitT family protein [Bacteroidia bacterium]